MSFSLYLSFRFKNDNYVKGEDQKTVRLAKCAARREKRKYERETRNMVNKANQTLPLL